MVNTLEWGTYDELPSARDSRAFLVVGPADVAGVYLSNGSSWTLATFGSSNAAPLAQAAQTPSEAPPGYGWLANPGSLDIAQRADAVLPVPFVPIVAGVGDYLDISAGTQNSTFRLVEAQEYAMLIQVPFTMSFDRIGFILSNNGTSGSVVRLGIRNFQPGSPATPGSVVLDAGSVATTAGAVAVTTITINKQLVVDETHAGFYWLTATAQGGAGTTAGVQLAGVPTYVRVIPSGSLPSIGRSNTGVSASGVTGALGSTFTVAGSLLDNVTPYLFLRRSA